MLFVIGKTNGSGHSGWIWHESFRWCGRKYYWQGA